MEQEINIKQEIENSLLLYLPTGINLNNEGTFEYEFERVSSLNYHVQLVAEGAIDNEHFLDYVESKDIDMDNYLEIACDNLEYILNL